MEQHDPSRRPYAPNLYAAPPHAQQAGAQPQQHQQSQFATPGPVDRFRQSSYLQQSPTSAAPGGRGGNEAQQLYAYPQQAHYTTATAMPTGSVQYAQGMQSPEQQRQPGPAQQYAQYGANVLYGMAQPQTPQTAQSPYDPVPQQTYRSRPSTASDTMATQFGVPQSGQYYLTGQPGPTSVPAPEYLPSQYQQQPESFAQPGISAAPAYQSTMVDPSQAAAYQAYAQQPQYTPHPQPQVDDQAFFRYREQIRNIFTLAHNSTLREVPSLLLNVSQYLLGNAEALGLTRDEESQHDERISLWDEFNRAWLTVLQRQHDLTEELLQTNEPPRQQESLVSEDGLTRLANELVRLCDAIERHGLVDYQMGVAEEEIMDLIIRCISLLRGPSERADEASPNPRSRSGAAR